MPETQSTKPNRAAPSMWRLGGLGWREVLRRLWQQFWEDRILDESAMLSFYFIFAIFPFLLFLVTLFGFVLQSGEAVHEAITKYLTTIAPSSASGLIDQTLGQVRSGSSEGTLSLSLLFSFWLAASGVVAVMDALNVAYDVAESRSWWKQRLVAFALTIGLVVFISAALVLLGFGARIAAVLAGSLSRESDWILAGWRILKWILLLAFLLMAFNLLYIFAPNVQHRRWHWLMPGTALGVSLWLLISYGFKTYLSFFNTYNLTYGSIAAVIILLFWFYLSSIAILIGGELNSIIEKRLGQVRGPPPGKRK